MANSSNRILLADYLSGQSTFGKNYVKNPSAHVNTANITASSVTITRNTTTPLTAISDIQVAYDAANDYAEWSMNTLDRSAAGRNCELRADYKLSLGSGATVVAQILQDGTVVASATLQNTSSSLPLSFNAPCGTASTTFRVTQTVGAVASTLNIANVTYGVATNISAQGLQTDWVAYTPSFTGLGTVTNISMYWARNGDNIKIKGKFTAGTTSGTPAIITLPNSLVIDSNKIPSGTIVGDVESDGDLANMQDIHAVYLSAVSTTGFSLTRRVAGGVNPLAAQNANNSFASNLTFGVEVELPIQGWAGQNAITIDQTNYDWTSYTPTFNGMGTVTNVEMQHKRSGSDLLIRGKFTIGTPTANEARIGLPSSLTSASTIKIPSIQLAGHWVLSAVQGSYMPLLIEPSVSYLTMSVQNAGFGGLTKQNGDTIINANASVSVQARIPIAGWFENQNAPILVGSVTSSSLSALKQESALVSSTGTVTELASSDWISGNASLGSSVYTITLNSGYTAAPQCQASIQGATAGFITVDVASATSVVVRTFNTAGSAADRAFYLSCLGPRS